MGFFRNLFGASQEKYDISAVVSTRLEETSIFKQARVQIICDLDKTYLETEFESWVKMAKIPFERPHEKITVAGAAEVLNAARWGLQDFGKPAADLVKPKVGLHFVSSSPPQLRNALDGKLTLDQLDWSSDTFKNQGYNLRMARIDLLRHHIAYKTKAILDIAKLMTSDNEIWMIGDNAEYDAFIYMGLKLFLDGSFVKDELASWLGAANVEKNVVDQVLEGLEQFNHSKPKVGGILIRRLAEYPLIDMKPLSSGAFVFDSWLQVAWVWVELGLIDRNQLWILVRTFHNQHGLSLGLLRDLFEELLKSGDLQNSDLKMEVLRLHHRLIGLTQAPSKRRSLKLENHRPLSFSKWSATELIEHGRKWYDAINNGKKS
jgi:hypothetical protein